MAHRFKKHYTLAEARAMMPRVREWLDSMVQLRHEYATISKRVDNMMSAQSDVGGDSVNQSIKLLSEIQAILGEFIPSVFNGRAWNKRICWRNPGAVRYF